MTTIELLAEALKALNEIPRKKLRGQFTDTYALAAEISRHIAATKKGN
jgi:hypothetical protein